MHTSSDSSNHGSGTPRGAAVATSLPGQLPGEPDQSLERLIDALLREAAGPVGLAEARDSAESLASLCGSAAAVDRGRLVVAAADPTYSIRRHAQHARDSTVGAGAGARAPRRGHVAQGRNAGPASSAWTLRRLWVRPRRHGTVSRVRRVCHRGAPLDPDWHVTHPCGHLRDLRHHALVHLQHRRPRAHGFAEAFVAGDLGRRVEADAVRHAA